MNKLKNLLESYTNYLNETEQLIETVGKKQILLDLVMDARKDQLWDLWYQFTQIGYYTEDKRKIRQFIMDVISNCYKEDSDKPFDITNNHEIENAIFNALHKDKEEYLNEDTRIMSKNEVNESIYPCLPDKVAFKSNYYGNCWHITFTFLDKFLCKGIIKNRSLVIGPKSFRMSGATDLNLTGGEINLDQNSLKDYLTNILPTTDRDEDEYFNSDQYVKDMEDYEASKKPHVFYDASFDYDESNEAKDEIRKMYNESESILEASQADINVLNKKYKDHLVRPIESYRYRQYSDVKKSKYIFTYLATLKNKNPNSSLNVEIYANSLNKLDQQIESYIGKDLDEDWDEYITHAYANDVTPKELNSNPVKFITYGEDGPYTNEFGNLRSLFKYIEQCGGFRSFKGIQWAIQSNYKGGEFYLYREKYARGGWQWRDVNDDIVYSKDSKPDYRQIRVKTDKASDMGDNLDESEALNEANLQDLINDSKATDPKRIKLAESIYTEYKGVDSDGTLLFESDSQTRSNLTHKQRIFYKTFFDLLDKVDENEEITKDDVLEILTGDLYLDCTCESFLYWAWAYKSWSQEYGLKRETRAPKRNNVGLNGGCCKHLLGVLELINRSDSLFDQIAKDLNTLFQNYKKQAPNANKKPDIQPIEAAPGEEQFARTAANLARKGKTNKKLHSNPTAAKYDVYGDNR